MFIVASTVSPDLEHDAVLPARQLDGQRAPGRGRGRLHRMVHSGVPAPVLGITQQTRLPQRRHERNRLARHHSILRIPHAARIEQEYRIVPERPPGDPNIPDHADSSDSEAGTTFHWVTISRLHPPPQLQRTRPSHDVSRHRDSRVFQSRLLRGKGRGSDEVREHTRDLLVGGDYDDDSRVWGYVPHDCLGQSGRGSLLRVWRASRRSTNSDYRQ